MTEDLPPAIGFDELRNAAIPAAQWASGDIWTDYNIHDPGVTLLEQTCFALTEIAYRGDHPVRDLLTLPDGGFTAGRLALFAPKEVLTGRAVTALDIAACLSATPGVDRVFVHKGAARGLLDIAVIPGPRMSAEDAIAAVRERFSSLRLIGSDAARIAPVRRHGLVLSGQIDISPFAKPDAIAAEVYHCINHALHGLGDDGVGGRSGADRGDLYDDPALQWPQVSAEPGDPKRLDLAMAALERIDGVDGVRDLKLTEPGTDLARLSGPVHGVVFDALLPTSEETARLELLLNGHPVRLDPDAIAEEYNRMVAARIARQGNRLDERDFDVMAPGRPRSVPARADVDAMLPAIYRTRGSAEARAYRTIINGHLEAMTAPIARLPHTYTARRPVDWSDPADIRRRIEMLDYLIALQGEEMPGTAQSGIGFYRSAADRLRWQVRWREDYLARLPQLNHYQGTAHPEFGVCARLAHLADLAPGSASDPAAPLQAAGIAPDDTVAPPAPSVESQRLRPPDQPLDTLLQRDANAPVMDRAQLHAHAPWVADGRTTPALYRRAAMPEAYLLARADDGAWQLLFDPGLPSGRLYRCATGPGRAGMERLGNRVCNSWQALNRDCEQVTLVEDILLRSEMTDFRPATVWALLTGWTARTGQPAYRRYVEDMILRVTPAHVHLRPVWLSLTDAIALQPRLADWRADRDGARSALRAALRDLAQDAAA